MKRQVYMMQHAGSANDTMLYEKISKVRKIAQPFQFLPPTNEALKENVKQAHLQAMVWYTSMEGELLQYIPLIMVGGGMS